MAAKVLENLLNAVRDNEQPVVVPGFLRPIDTDRIARDFNIESVALDRGGHELPESEDQELDSVEHRIIQKIEGEWAWQGGELLNNLRAYANRLASYSIPAEFLKLQLQGEDTLVRLRLAAGQALAELAPLQERCVGARDELAEFRKKHRLSRPAREHARRWTTFGLLFIFVAFESVLNGFFFAKGSEFGLVGGIGTSVGISTTNVAFSFLLGLWPMRWKNHRNFFVWTFGLLVTVAGLLLIIGLHLFAAHFRSATAAVGEDRAINVAIDELMRSPWKFSDLSSIYLFAMGTLFALSAIWKGYTFDDPYPRFGAVDRRAVIGREAYTDAHFELFEELESIKEETIESLDAGITRLPKFPQLAANVLSERAAMIHSFRAYEASIETSANQLLKLYRDTNRSARRTAPPAYFHEKWRLPHSFLARAEIRTLLADPEVGDVGSSLMELRRLLLELLGQYEQLHSRYPHPSEMK
jgi:hypothetical protein